MTGIENLEGWELVWFCVGVGFLGGGLLTAFNVFAGIAERLWDEWEGWG